MKQIKKLFTAGRVPMGANFSINELVDELTRQGQGVGSPLYLDPSLTLAISKESFDNPSAETSQGIAGAYASLEETLKTLGFESYNDKRAGDSTRVTENQIVAATLANLGSSDEGRYKKLLRSMGSVQHSSDPSIITVQPMLDGPFGSVSTLTNGQGLENYNEKSQRDFRVISVAYNLAASRQDAFGEALYPTVVINPTEGGVTQNLTYAAVLKDVFHQTTGALFDTREVNMVEAFRDPTVLEDASTRLIPVVADDNSNLALFVDAALVPPTTVELERGGSVETAPLAIGKKFDLIGISNRAQLVAGNLLDITDTIDPALRLKAIYVKTTGTSSGSPAVSSSQVIRFTVDRLPTAVFQPSLVGDTRIANLAFNTEDLVINGNTTGVDGSKKTELTEVGTRGWTLRLSVGVSGSVSTSKGDTFVNATPAVVDKIVDADGVLISKTAGTGLALIQHLGALTIVGYELEARFTNTNRRERGQLVQTRTLQFRYPVPMHSPITLPMSTLDENGPGDVVKTLTVATNIRNSNNAVTRLLNYLAQLKEVVGAGFDRPKFGAVEGALSAMIRPTYRHATLDLPTAIDAIRAKDRWDDVSAVILDKIGGLLFPAYRDSNIEAAFQTTTGNTDERPKFIIACDKEIANYLMRSGDDRTLGAYLKYDIVSTNNEKFDGKIVVVPTRENPVENDILNFGAFYYVPTIVADLPISRNGQVSREIAAIPFNLHVNNIPFAIEIDVTGLAEVMGSSVYNQAL